MNISRRGLFVWAAGAIVLSQTPALASPYTMEQAMAEHGRKIREAMAYLDEHISFHLRSYLFKHNTEELRAQIRNHLGMWFQNGFGEEHGVESGWIVCDERNNSPLVVQRNELVVSCMFNLEYVCGTAISRVYTLSRFGVEVNADWTQSMTSRNFEA